MLPNKQLDARNFETMPICPHSSHHHSSSCHSKGYLEMALQQSAPLAPHFEGLLSLNFDNGGGDVCIPTCNGDLGNTSPYMKTSNLAPSTIFEPKLCSFLSLTREFKADDCEAVATATFMRA
ncbi:hypothetical protein L7F22_013689 [Adiantum nelumboides]|nr:hypothetical protein [Adiantum nelumboides]